MPKIYFIIVTYNAMKWAEKCFTSLRKSSVPVHCIVIDNGSTDGTQDYIKSHFPEVSFLQSEKNLGFGKANNIGIEQAYKEGADFVYLMNQDAWLYEDSLEKLLNVYNSHQNKEEIGIISPMHIDGTEKKLDIFLDKYISYTCDKTRLISDLYFQTLKPAYELDFVNAAHWLMPKSTIEIVGGFNPFFFIMVKTMNMLTGCIIIKRKSCWFLQAKLCMTANSLWIK
ncbi:glycosyltransferase family 2 protein [Chryseobacterium arachidis]|uniref:glycosyltransferase family 2 protein n=1 Tax=Chryseobacterium arachidis TaxID=1416778 RepID=UPI0036192784